LSEKKADVAMAMDEGRFGLKTWFRRRWCPLGERPPWIVEDRYEWLWLYAAIEPASGKSIFLLLPQVDGNCLKLFLDEMRKQVSGTIALVLDGSGSHRSASVQWPVGIEPILLPAYSPELDPVEQVFRQVRAKLSNRIFESLQELETAIIEVLREFWQQPQLIIRLTAYPWWIEGVQQIASLAS